jgi:prepilin-type N-terminal cleavage/methylation domain-containing protein
MCRTLSLASFGCSRRGTGRGREGGNGPFSRRVLRPVLTCRGFSLIETIIVSAVALVSLLLVFQMLSHLSLWWTRQEYLQERTANARYVLKRVGDLLFMAGYRPSVRGVHLMEPDRLAVEYLVDGAEEEPGRSTRHRLFTLCRDGSRLKLITQRRLLPLEAPSAWGEGSTTVLAEEVRDLSFRYLDRAGRDTTSPDDVRAVELTLRLGAPGQADVVPCPEVCFRSAYQLRNFRG